MGMEPTIWAGLGGALVALLLGAVVLLAFNMGQRSGARERREARAVAPTATPSEPDGQGNPPTSPPKQGLTQASAQPPLEDQPDPVGAFLGVPMPAAVPTAVLVFLVIVYFFAVPPGVVLGAVAALGVLAVFLVRPAIATAKNGNPGAYADIQPHLHLIRTRTDDLRQHPPSRDARVVEQANATLV